MRQNVLGENVNNGELTLHLLGPGLVIMNLILSDIERAYYDMTISCILDITHGKKPLYVSVIIP